MQERCVLLKKTGAQPWSHVALARAAFASWKACDISGDQDSTELGGNPPRRQLVSGRRMQAALGTKMSVKVTHA